MFVCKVMYSAVRVEDYLATKSIFDIEGAVVEVISPSFGESRDPDSDEFLLIAVGNSQDTEAFDRLFQRYSSRIFALGKKMTRDEQLSNDLVQEAMLNVWRKARLYDLDRGSAQGWIFTIARNRCFDMLRKSKRQPQCVTADDIWPEEGGADAEFVHEEQGSLAAETAIIASYYEQLPDLQKAAIEQIYILDRTHEEAAAVLKIPLGTLKSRLRLGVSKLKQLIGVDQ